MPTLLDITSNDQTMTVVIAAIVVLVVAAVLVRFIIRMRGESDFRKQAEALRSQVHETREELETLLLPTHLVSDDDIESFKTRHQALLESIDAIEGHKYYNEEIFKETGIAPFKALLAESPAKKKETNKVYSTIVELKDCALKVMDNYRSLVHPAHYFTHSELEEFFDSYNEIKEKVDFIFPEYAQFVTDEDSKELPAVIQRIESERDAHNKEFVKTELEANKLYFDHVLGT